MGQKTLIKTTESFRYRIAYGQKKMLCSYGVNARFSKGNLQIQKSSKNHNIKVCNTILYNARNKS